MGLLKEIISERFSVKSYLKTWRTCRIFSDDKPNRSKNRVPNATLLYHSFQFRKWLPERANFTGLTDGNENRVIYMSYGETFVFRPC